MTEDTVIKKVTDGIYFVGQASVSKSEHQGQHIMLQLNFLTVVSEKSYEADLVHVECSPVLAQAILK